MGRPPSHPLDGPDDHGSLLSVVSWFLLALAVLVVLTRLGTRWRTTHSLSLDDGFIVISAMFAIGQVISLDVGVDNGLGMATLPANLSQTIALQKSIYASNILFIMSQCFSKLSAISLIRSLSPISIHTACSSVIAVATIVWTFSAVIGFIFECQVPQTWNILDGVCFDRSAFFIFVQVFNLLLDTSLIILPVTMFAPLQVKARPKIIVIGCFLCRILVVAALITQLILFHHPRTLPLLTGISDPFLSWPIALSTSLIQSLGIVTACVSHLKPFLESVNSGMIGNDDFRRRVSENSAKHRHKQGNNSTYTSQQLSSSSPPFDGRNVSVGAHARGKTSMDGELEGMPRAHQVRHETFVSADPMGAKGRREWDLNSQASNSRMIRQTTTVAWDG